MNQVLQGDCLEELKKLPENSVDAVVTDPPYELGFMGKSWDSTGIANNVEMWKETLRVLKPGGHLLAFSGTRTYHRMASAIEDAGFEVRDMIEWVYGSGFPKSLNIGKAVDKLQGNERIKTGEIKHHAQKGVAVAEERGAIGGGAFGQAKDEEITKGTSEWEGWGTALKPAHEPICMARKPLAEKTVAENCLKYGTGGINIDESRVGTTDELKEQKAKGSNGGEAYGDYNLDATYTPSTLGRFPANLIHDNSEEVRECFPDTKSGSGNKNKNPKKLFGATMKSGDDKIWEADSGNASRFFKSIIYQAKASKSDRGEGNNHATVKPTSLMEYLIKMVTKEGQTVLDPFGGSGTTGVACKNTGRNYILIEKEQEYIDIINNRLYGTSI